MLVFSGETGWAPPKLHTVWAPKTHLWMIRNPWFWCLVISTSFNSIAISNAKIRLESATKRDKKKSCHILSPQLFFCLVRRPHLIPPKLLCWHFRGTAGTCHEMVSLQCQTRGLSPCQPPGVFNPPSSLFGFRQGNTGKYPIMEGEIHMGKANQLVQNL